MRIGVTGVSGFVGSWLSRELEASGHEVVGADCAPGPRVSKFGQFDITNRSALSAWFWDSEPDVVVHLAALYGRLQGEQDPVRTVQVNTAASVDLGRLCDAADIPFVFASTSEVYGRDDRLLLRPDMTDLSPRNMYGLSKLWAEQALARYVPRRKVLRLNMPYGPASPERGVVRNSATPNFQGVNFLVMALWRLHHRLPLEVHEGTVRSYTWVGDAVRAVRLVLESGLSGTWNVCQSDDYVSAWDIALMALELTGASRRLLTVVPPPPDVTPLKRMDTQDLYDMGWRPTKSFADGVQETYEYVKHFDKDLQWVQ